MIHITLFCHEAESLLAFARALSSLTKGRTLSSRCSPHGMSKMFSWLPFFVTGHSAQGGATLHAGSGRGDFGKQQKA